MRPIRITMNAQGTSQWVPIDDLEAWFGVGLAVIPSTDGNLTYSVQHTFDDLKLDMQGAQTQVTIQRVGNLATVVDAGPNYIGHGLSVGDSVLVKGSGSSSLDSPPPTFGQGDVGLAITAATPGTYSYATLNSGPNADAGNAHALKIRVFNHATLTGQTTRQTGTYNYPVTGIRLYVSAYTTGFVDLDILQGDK